MAWCSVKQQKQRDNFTFTLLLLRLTFMDTNDHFYRMAQSVTADTCISCVYNLWVHIY